MTLARIVRRPASPSIDIDAIERWNRGSTRKCRKGISRFRLHSEGWDRFTDDWKRKVEIVVRFSEVEGGFWLWEDLETTRTQARHARHTEDVAGCSPGPCESIRRMESDEE